MDDTSKNLILPQWMSRRHKWQLELWSDKQDKVNLYVETTGKRGKRFSGWLQRDIARALLQDVRDAQKLLIPRPRSLGARFLARLTKRKEVFRASPDYTLVFWGEKDRRFQSLTIHPAMLKDPWLLCLQGQEAQEFADDLRSAIVMAEHVEEGAVI